MTGGGRGGEMVTVTLLKFVKVQGNSLRFSSNSFAE